MATTRLKIYNGALLVCEERSLGALTDDVEARYALDEVWNDGGVRFCLEQGQWKFAMRSAKMTYDPAIAPDWGYQHGVAKPSDWVTTSAVCQDEYFRVPLLGYSDEIGYWFFDLEDVYIKWVSDDSSYGGDLSKWPNTFTEYVKAHFATKIIARLAGGNEERIARVHKIADKAKFDAKNRDAMQGPTTFPAQGSWLRSRFGRNSGSRDGGNRSGNLTG